MGVDLGLKEFAITSDGPFASLAWALLFVQWSLCYNFRHRWSGLIPEQYLNNQAVIRVNRLHDLNKFIKLTGDRAKLDAKANGTYIVYKTSDGHMVKEYSNGDIERIEVSELSNE